jgi:hypothetical protein
MLRHSVWSRLCIFEQFTNERFSPEQDTLCMGVSSWASNRLRIPTLPLPGHCFEDDLLRDLSLPCDAQHSGQLEMFCPSAISCLLSYFRLMISFRRALHPFGNAELGSAPSMRQFPIRGRITAPLTRNTLSAVFRDAEASFSRIGFF